MFLNIPLCRGRRDKSTGENPTKNRRATYLHTPTRANVRTDHAPHAPSSPEFLKLNRVDPPCHQLVVATTSILHRHPPRHSTSQQFTAAHATSSVITCTFAMSSKGGPICLRGWHIIILSFDPVLRGHYFIWHVASSAPSIDLKVWLINLSDFNVVSNVFDHSGHIHKVRFSRFKSENYWK